MNLFDDAGLSGCVRAAPEMAVSERELIVRLRVAGREFGRASEMFDGGGRLALLNQRAPKRDARLVGVGVERNGAFEFAHAFGQFVAAKFDEQDAETEMTIGDVWRTRDEFAVSRERARFVARAFERGGEKEARAHVVWFDGDGSAKGCGCAGR